MCHRVVLRYIERKTESQGRQHLNDKGPAWIARVMFSKSGRSLYFGQHSMGKIKGFCANYMDDNRDEWWVSGVKKNGLDRHWAGSGKIFIEVGAVEEYLEIIGEEKLDKSRFQVIPDFPPPDITDFHELQNRPFDPIAYAQFFKDHFNSKRG